MYTYCIDVVCVMFELDDMLRECVISIKYNSCPHLVLNTECWNAYRICYQLHYYVCDLSVTAFQ